MVVWMDLASRNNDLKIKETRQPRVWIVKYVPTEKNVIIKKKWIQHVKCLEVEPSEKEKIQIVNFEGFETICAPQADLNSDSTFLQILSVGISVPLHPPWFLFDLVWVGLFVCVDTSRVYVEVTEQPVRVGFLLPPCRSQRSVPIISLDSGSLHPLSHRTCSFSYFL